MPRQIGSLLCAQHHACLSSTLVTPKTCVFRTPTISPRCNKTSFNHHAISHFVHICAKMYTVGFPQFSEIINGYLFFYQFSILNKFHWFLIALLESHSSILWNYLPPKLVIIICLAVQFKPTVGRWTVHFKTLVSRLVETDRAESIHFFATPEALQCCQLRMSRPCCVCLHLKCMSCPEIVQSVETKYKSGGGCYSNVEYSGFHTRRCIPSIFYITMPLLFAIACFEVTVIHIKIPTHKSAIVFIRPTVPQNLQRKTLIK